METEYEVRYSYTTNLLHRAIIIFSFRRQSQVVGRFRVSCGAERPELGVMRIIQSLPVYTRYCSTAATTRNYVSCKIFFQGSKGRAKKWILGSYMHKDIDVFWRKFKPLRRCKARRRNLKESYELFQLYDSIRFRAKKERWIAKNRRLLSRQRFIVAIYYIYNINPAAPFLFSGLSLYWVVPFSSLCIGDGTPSMASGS